MRKKSLLLGAIIVLVIVAIGYTDLILRPGYLIKTMVKAPLFLFVPIVYSLYDKKFRPFGLVASNMRGVKFALALGVGIYAVMLAFYLIIRRYIDVDTMMVASLENNLGVNEDNFFQIALYVCIVNSFLEEWFFRGFVFTQFRAVSRRCAYVVSSLSFAVYHLAIIESMFSVGLVMLLFVGLFVGGTIFNYLNEKNDNIYASWFCHMFANFAMNTVGYLVFFVY